MKNATQNVALSGYSYLADVGRINKISLGKPITAPCLIPVLHAATPICINHPFMVGGEVYKVTALSFGTPHGVVFVDDVTAIDVMRVGWMLGTHVLFPKGASIVFAEMIDGETIEALLWFNGKGEFMLTPEAAGAAAAASIMLQRATTRSVKVSGGENTFFVEWDRIGEVFLTASADLIPLYLPFT